MTRCAMCGGPASFASTLGTPMEGLSVVDLGLGFARARRRSFPSGLRGARVPLAPISVMLRGLLSRALVLWAVPPPMIGGATKVARTVLRWPLSATFRVISSLHLSNEIINLTFGDRSIVCFSL